MSIQTPIRDRARGLRGPGLSPADMATLDAKVAEAAGSADNADGSADDALAAAGVSTTQATRSALQTYLNNKPFTDGTAANAYTNALLQTGDTTTTQDGGIWRYDAATTPKWTRTGDSDGKVAADSAASIPGIMDPYVDDAEAAEAGAAGYARAAQDAADLVVTGTNGIYDTYATANAAIGTIANNAVILVLGDETQGGRRTLYREVSGALVFKRRLKDGPADWYVSPTGSDSNIGSLALPFATIAKAVQMSTASDRIVVKRNADGSQVVFKENIALSNNAANDNRVFLGNGCLFDAYDDVVPVWTSMGSDVWKCTINLTVGSGGLTAHGDPNKEYTGFFASKAGVDTNGIVNNCTGTASEASILAALASAADFSYSMRNGPVVGGTASGTINGFVYGNHDFYFKMPAGADPSTYIWRVQQRRQPAFGNGWTFETPFTAFGGWAHNGVEMIDATFKCSPTIAYPSNHGSFICGAQSADHGSWPAVYGRNNTGAAGYAWHLFNGGTRRRYTVARGPRAYDYGHSSNDNLWGGHGSNQGNDICQGLHVIDLEAYNCWGLGGSGDLTYGCVFWRAKMIGSKGPALGSGTNPTYYEPTIVSSGFGASSAVSMPAVGQTATVIGGSITSNPEGLFLNHSTAGGTLSFQRTMFLIGAERTNSRWFSSTSTGTLNFTDCVIEGVCAGDNGVWMQQNTGGLVVNFTDCAISGLTPPTNSVFVRTQRGGDLGLARGPGADVVADPRDMSSVLGEEIIGFTTINNSGVNYVTSYLLTKLGVHLYSPNTPNTANNPRWTALNAYSLSGSTGVFKVSVANWFVAWGKDGSNNAVILRYNVNDAVTASPVAVDLTTPTLTGKTITGVVSGGIDGKLWFGCSDGTVIEVDMSNSAGSGGVPLAVARPTGATYPLIGGVRNDATILMVGSDAAGASGTVGGAIISSDTGATWANSLTSADNTPASIGTWAVRTKRAVFVNGVYVIFGARGMMLTSTTAVSGSWTSRTLKSDVDVDSVSVPAVSTDYRVLVGGKPGLGQDYKGQRLMMIDASVADPANWVIRHVSSPVSQIGHVRTMTTPVGPNTLTQFCIAGKLRELAVSEDGYVWRRATWPAPLRVLSTPTSKLLPQMLAA
ncbi:hypothetical protein OSJ57_15225 [Sphingomonas sp. HH69]